MTSSDLPPDETRPAEPPTAPPAGPAGGSMPYPPPPSGPYGQPYPAQAYPAQPYPAQPYPAQPYPAQAYPAQPYPAQPYPTQPYPAPAAYPAPAYAQSQSQGYVQPHQAPQPTSPYQPQQYAGYQHWSPGGYQVQPYAAAAGPRRIRRRPLVLAVIALVAAVVLAGVAVQQFQASRAPAQVVQRYFAAIAAGKAETALNFQAVPPRGSYLTSYVLSEQRKAGPLSDVHVSQLTQSGDQASAQVDYVLALPSGRRQVQDRVALVKHGSSWKLKSAAALVDLGVTSTGGDRVTLAGAAIPQTAVYLFPGALPLDTDSSALAIDGDPNVRLADDGQSVGISVGLTTAAKRNLTATLRTALANCLSGKSRDANCPQIQDVRPVPNSLRATVPATISGLSIALDSSGRGEVSLSGEVPVHGSWKVWDFNNQAVAKSGNTDLDVSAVASVADLDTIFWRAS